MSEGSWLTRARLRRDGSAAALVKVLSEQSTRDAGHALMWSLFADGPDRRRDFLWRQAGDGVFYILSARPPVDSHHLFELDPPKAFAPALAAGDELVFSLHANPVVRRRADGLRLDGRQKRVAKDDVVMHAIRPSEPPDRAAARDEAIQNEGFAWLARQGDRAGFSVTKNAVRIGGYSRTDIARDGAKAVSFRTLEFDGRLSITEPELFVRRLKEGFGASRGYGCGLMLIRRG